MNEPTLCDELREFGFEPYDPALHGADLPASMRAILSPHGGEKNVDVAQVLVSADLVYVPWTWIGCCGWLVERAGGRAFLLGSASPVAVHVWAYRRGFADGDSPGERLNDLVITAIHRPPETEDFLRHLFVGSYYRAEVRPRLQALPLRLKSIGLYLHRTTLWHAEREGWFDFRVEPATEAG